MEKGDKVYFGRNHGERTLGEVVKVNSKSVQVRTLESRGTMKGFPVGTVFRVAPSLCHSADGSVEAPVAPSVAARAELMSQIQATYARLSPENLSCDGELQGAARARKKVALQAHLKTLFRQIGRVVHEEETYEP